MLSPRFSPPSPWTRPLSRASLIAGLIAASGCGRIAESSQNKIYGGRPVALGEHLDAVALTDSEGIFCSGTALTPTLIVTAAHCLQERDASEVRIYVGEGEAGGRSLGQYAVSALAINPRFDPQNPDLGFDSAYLVLALPLNIPVATLVPVLTDPLERKELLRGGSDAYLVGFGYSKKSVLGVKSEARAIVRKLYAVEAELGGKGRDACQGDSGGPAYGLLKSGEWRLYGITSRGSDCGNGGIWGLLGEKGNICWIQAASGQSGIKIPADYCADYPR